MLHHQLEHMPYTKQLLNFLRGSEKNRLISLKFTFSWSTSDFVENLFRVKIILIAV